MEPVVNWRDHFLPTVRAAYSDADARIAEAVYRMLVRRWEVLGLACVVMPYQTMHPIGFELNGLQAIITDRLRNHELHDDPHFVTEWEWFLEKLLVLAARQADPPACDRCNSSMSAFGEEWICWNCIITDFFL
jgi:hypothetical protein